MSEELKVTVSNEFIKIYRNFNVVSQFYIINKLKENNEIEFYLLMIKVLDSHQEDDKIVQLNLLPFEDQIMEIYEMQDDKEVNNDSLKELSKLTSNVYVDTSCLVDLNGDSLPNPYTKSEIRDLKIDIITNESKD